MFSPPRYVVVDDKPEHAAAIVRAIQALGSSCASVVYDPAEPVPTELFRGVRVIFMDFHLLPGPTSTDGTNECGIIGSVLEAALKAAGQHYVLVLWTEHPQYGSKLVEYLDASPLDCEKPTAVLALSKADFLEIGADVQGQISAEKLQGLQTVISNQLASLPQLTALTAWEMDIFEAVTDTLISVVSVIPKAERTISGMSPALDRVLSALAVASVGQQNVAVDPGQAVRAALGPLLLDRAQHRHPTSAVNAAWTAAVTQVENYKLSPEANAKLNSALHIALHADETIRASDWGAVIELRKVIAEKDDPSHFGQELSKILLQDYKIDVGQVQSLCLIRVGAVCDHAQGKIRPIPYLLAALVPVAVAKGKSTSEAIWKSPPLYMSNDIISFQVHSGVQLSFTHEAVKQVPCLFRMREQMLLSLVARASAYTARPGMIQF